MLARWQLGLRIDDVGVVRFRHVRALVASWVEAGLDEPAHHANRKPFRVEPLQRVEGNRFHLQVITLTRSAGDRLADALGRAQDAGEPMRLGATRAQFAAGATPVPVHQTSYGDLAACDPRTDVGLQFVSPTMFLSGKGPSTPFPLPGLVFGHLRDRWRIFADVPVPPFDVKAHGLHVRDFQGRSALVSFGHRARHGRFVDRTQAGFVGDVTYALTDRGGTTGRAFHTYARFAEWAGVGANTTLGMGATRLAPAPDTTIAEAG